MTYDTERVKIGRKPVLLCDLELDKCANTYGETITNLVTQSEDFTHADWSGSATVTADQATAPDGTLTADELEDNSAGLYLTVSQTLIAIDSAEYYTGSVYIKKDTTGRATRFPVLRLFYAGAANEYNYLALDTATGEISLDADSTVGIYGVESAGDYWRIHMSVKTVAANTTVGWALFPSRGASASWTISAAAQGIIFAWGAELTEGNELHGAGAGACAATGSSGNECYNTRATCHDLANYNPVVPHIYTLSDVLVPGENFLHCIDSTQLAPTVIKPDKGLGIRASIKITLNDFPHHDRGVDPYVATRAYTPIEQGTFFNKLVARNLHTVGRPLRIKTGYVGDAFDINDFQTRNYVIDGITGPDSRGRFTITAKDILALADDARAVAPAVSTGVLTGAITSGSTSLTVTSGTESEYTGEKYLRIGDEIILAPLANRSANVFSNLSRGQFNTTADAHDIGDTAQSCKWLDGENCVDLVYDLLVNYAGIDSSYINTTDWDDERDTWYSTADINTVISEATGVTELINALAEQFFFQIWWNEIDQEILFKPIVPPAFGETITELNDDANLIGDSVMVTRDAKKRLSRVVVHYNPKTPIETDAPKDYKSFYVRIDADAESSDEYGDIRQKIIFARFIDSEALAVQVGGRLLSRYRNSPRDIKFRLDAKDSDLVTGDLADVESRAIQGIDGANDATRFQVTSFKEITRDASGTHYEYSGIEVNFYARYGYIGPNTLNDYDVESDANKDQYGFIALDTAVFSDDTDAYRII